MTDLLRLSGTAIARLIREGTVTAREAVDVHIARIEAVNPVLNAVVADRFDEARAEAAEADLLLRRVGPGGVPALHGVPCTIKESFALTGMPNSGGLVARRHVRATSDATTVARLRAAGAIPLGVTNLSELCMWMESDNRVYGRCNNPYDPRRIVGGSSGGEGAIVGAGAVPFGLAADIGGSVRMPAFFNGVFGHKPTGTLVPNTGQFPVSENAALRYLCIGPIARRAEDLFPLLEILAGPDGRDAVCEERALGDPATVDLSRLRVLDVPDDGGRIRVSRDLRAAQRRCASHLRDLGCRVIRVRLDQLRHAFEIWSAMLEAAGGTPFAVLLGNGRAVAPGPELLRWAAGRSAHTLPAILLALFEKAPKLLRSRARRMVELGRALRGEVADLIGPDGVMLYPSHARAAPRHVEPLLFPTRFAYTAIMNVLELPATQVPLGLDGRGLPLGVQVVGQHGQDHLTIAVALELERAFGGWVFPEKLA